MCLAALAIGVSPRFPFVVAANRDEFFQRATAPLDWWSAEGGAPDILGGRDLQEGGTWLGLSAAGRLALLTNVREPHRIDPLAPSRGRLVPLWLHGDLSAERYWAQVAQSGYNGFNLIAADWLRGECFWASNRHTQPQRLECGVYGLSNAALDTPWPKVVALKARLAQAVSAASSTEGLAAALFAALADRSIAPDDQLPSTGVSPDRERQLSAAHIAMPDHSYGTRSATVIVTERVHARSVTHVFERTFTPGCGLALLRQATLEDWPPQGDASASARPVRPGHVVELGAGALAG